MESVKDLLNDPLKGTTRAQGVLCYLFRQVLVRRTINTRVWNRCLDNYFLKPHNLANPDKGNLNKALKADDLTWSSFRKSIDFLNPVQAILEIEFEWGNGKSSTYKLIIDPTENETKPTINVFPYDMLDTFKGLKKPKTVMASLFRHIVVNEGHDKAAWDKLFVDWAANPINTIGQSETEIASSVVTLRRSVNEDNLSWNVFRRGILLLKPKRSTYTLTLDWTLDPAVKIPQTQVQAIVTDPYWVG